MGEVPSALNLAEERAQLRILLGRVVGACLSDLQLSSVAEESLVMSSGGFLASLDWSGFACCEASPEGLSWACADKNGRKISEKKTALGGMVSACST